MRAMTITLTPEQMQWIEEAVAAGQFPSVEDAVRVAVADLKMSLDLENLDWAKPYIEEARRDVARGNVISGDEFLAWLDGRIKTPRPR
jgi:Arc/MetJ-type ribon-helix-helix transcriptional regulator